MRKNSHSSTMFVLVLVIAMLACGSPTFTTTVVTSAPLQTSSNPQPTGNIDLQPAKYASCRDSIDNLWFVGLVLNNGNSDAENIEVALSLVDSSGNVAAVGSDSISYISANNKFPFRALITNAPKNWKDVKIQIQGSPAGGQTLFPAYLNFKTDSVTGKVGILGTYELNGTVLNTGQKTATLVHVVAAAYDADGNVTDVGDTYSTLTDIAPSADSPFSLDFTCVKKEPASYELYVESLTK